MMAGESRLIISDATFIPSHDDDEEESSEEEEDDDEEYDDDMAVDGTPSRNGKKRGKARRRGRPTRSSARTSAKTAMATKKKPNKPGEVQLKLNGVVMSPQADQPGEWDVLLPLGSSTLQIGEVGGLTWKVYIEKLVG